MKKRCFVLLVIVLAIISIISILIKNSVIKNNSNIIKEYNNLQYTITAYDKDLLAKRLNININTFNELLSKSDQYAEIKIEVDNDDGKAGGSIKINFDKKYYEDILTILKKSGKIMFYDSNIGFYDEYCSVYLSKDYLYNDNNKIGLIFNTRLPYRYNNIEQYNENIKFFLKFI